MTLKAANTLVNNLWSSILEMSILRANMMRNTGCSWGAAFDGNPEAKEAYDRAAEAREALLTALTE
jgi:hypothetical protein